MITLLIKSSVIFFIFMISAQSFVNPPIAKKIPFTDDFHNDPRVDNYRWMHDHKNAAVIDHLNLENKYTNSYLKKYEHIKQDVFKSMVGSRKKRSKLWAQFLPTKNIFTEKKQTENYYHWYLADKSGSSKKEILDENIWAKEFSYFKILSFNISPDFSKALILVDTKGRGHGELYLFSLKNFVKTKLNTSILWGSDFQWIDNDKVLLFGAENEKDVYQLHTYDLINQKEVAFYQFDKKYKGHKRGLYTNLEKNRILIDLSTFSENTVFELLENRIQKTIGEKKGILNLLEETNGRRFVISNKDSNNKAIYELLDGSFKKIYAPQKGIIDNVHFSKTHATIIISNEGINSLEVLDLKTYLIQNISLGAKLVSLSRMKIDSNKNEVYYQLGSFTKPKQQFKCHLKNCVPIKIDNLPVGTNSNLLAKRINVKARDGVEIPVSLIYNKGALSGKPKKLYLDGYGSYGATIKPTFQREYIELLKRGFIVAIAHIRGGGVKGKKWHDDGRYFKKLNTFYDFIDVTKFLLKNKITSTKELAIEGRSAGGLLMGAVLNMRPDLYRVAVLGVPFVDVLNTMTLYYDPLAKYETKEWGDGLIKNEYDYIKRYDPYTNIRKTIYPSMYVFTGFEDTAVYYFQPMKWVAKMREINPASINPLVFDITFKGGHGGGSSQDSFDLAWAKKISFIIGEIESTL